MRRRQILVILCITLFTLPELRVAAMLRLTNVITVRMPEAWIAHLRPVLNSLSDSNQTWTAQSSGNANLAIEPLAGNDSASRTRWFTLAALAALVPVESPVYDVDLETLLAILAGRPTAQLSLWQITASREVSDLAGLAVLKSPRAALTDHLGALNAALAHPNHIALVRWQTATPGGWPGRLRPLRINGMYPGQAGSVAWYGAVMATSPAATPLAEKLHHALQVWGELPVEIAAVGDIMLAREVGATMKAFPESGFPFQHTAAILSASDIAVGNLECAISDRGEPQPKKAYPFRAEPWTVAALARAGFDVLSLGNNHSMDYGAEAMLDTAHLLDATGIANVGAGPDETAAREPVFIERRGVKFAFLAYVKVREEASGFNHEAIRAGSDRPGVAWAVASIIAEDVRVAAARADVVVVLLHSGTEYTAAPNADQENAARAALQAGAKLVLGAHPHGLQGAAYRRGTLIAYSLGNFVFDMADIGITTSALLRVWVGKDGVRASAWEPMIIALNGQPRPASPEEAGPIMAGLNRLSQFLNR